MISEWRVSVALCGSFDAWRDIVAMNARIAQQIEGIPIRTIQEAIDAGEYATLQ